MFSELCRPGGTAPVVGGGSHATHNYRQNDHPTFAEVVAQAPGAPSGICLGLTIEWFRLWRSVERGSTGFSVWAVRHANNVRAHTVAVHTGDPALWPARTDTIMAGLGITAVVPGGLGAPANQNLCRPALIAAIPVARAIIIVASGAGRAHAMGVFKCGNSVFFFDPNHGEIYFSTPERLGDWFSSAGCRTACLTGVAGGGAGVVAIRLMRYTWVP